MDTRIRTPGIYPALKSSPSRFTPIVAYQWEKLPDLYKISIVAVLKRIRAADLDVAPLNSTYVSDIVMIDEVWHFVNGKKTKYGFGQPLMG
ncbi:MAG: hypothetical protein K2P93_06470 [Alphaproteobacteria bacterium]|nr:hypothetical protein [Alphaproteobacteria bacterium]